MKGSSCLVVEDVVTSGASVLETCADLKRVGLKVAHVVVLLDREQGGRGNVEREGVVLHSVLTMSQLMQYLLETGKVTSETVDMVKAFIRENSQVKIVEKCNPTVSSIIIYTFSHSSFQFCSDYVIYGAFPTCC